MLVVSPSKRQKSSFLLELGQCQAVFTALLCKHAHSHTFALVLVPITRNMRVEINRDRRMVKARKRQKLVERSLSQKRGTGCRPLLK